MTVLDISQRDRGIVMSDDFRKNLRQKTLSGALTIIGVAVAATVTALALLWLLGFDFEWPFGPL
jgi:hypothetical protein